MKRTLLALALAVAVLSVAAPAQALPWCTADGQNLWTFHSGSTNISNQFSWSITWAESVAMAECQEAWDNSASNASNLVDDDFDMQLYVVGDCPGTFYFRCKACIEGHPYLDPKPVELEPWDAGTIGTNAVPGRLIGVRLITRHEQKLYLVDILTKTGQEQVEVDVRTREAKRMTLEPEAVCPVR